MFITRDTNIMPSIQLDTQHNQNTDKPLSGERFNHAAEAVKTPSAQGIQGLTENSLSSQVLSTRIDPIDSQQVSTHNTTDITQHATDLHPQEPIAKATHRKIEGCINEVVWLTATNPQIDELPTKRLMVVLNNHHSETEVLVDLKTNDTSLMFLCQVVRQQFNHWYSIFESWEPVEPF